MEIVKRGFTPEEFTEYVAGVKMGGWRPVGVTLHNTWAPTLAQWPGVVNGKKISVEQRLENIRTGYVAKGWRAGPHLFIDTEKIWVFTPINTRGLHSPSFNSTHWGVELVGNFDKEAFPDSMRKLAVHAIRTLYDKIDAHADKNNFKFHRDDSRTTHKDCPGKAVGSKESWIAEINAVGAPPAPKPVPQKPEAKPVADAKSSPKTSVPEIPDEAVQLVMRWEAFRADPYQDGARKAIGYGRNEGHRGFVITEGMKVTQKQAEEWLREDLAEIAETLKPHLRVQVTPNQLGAMCSLGYNIGPGNLVKSSVVKYLNEGKLNDAAQAFLRWNKVRDPKTGQLVERKGLTRRRTDEKWLFQKVAKDK